MRLNWLCLLPVLLVILVLTMGYLVFTEPVDKPKVSQAEAMEIARTCFPDMSMENSSATLGAYRIEGKEGLAWYVDVKTVPGLNGYIAYIVVVNANEPGYPASWGGIVTVDAMTGEVLHINNVG